MTISIEDIINIIPRYPQIHGKELISALGELNSLIGLEKIKEDVYGQVAYAIMLLDLKVKNKYMLHTLITGPPGVGKSNLANILGKIWGAIGIIGKNIAERKDLKKEEGTIYHLIRNIEFIKENVDIIKKEMIEELEITDEELTDRLNWICETCEDCEKSGKYVTDMVNKEKKPIIFKKATRADLVGKWQGHTADQTRKILQEAMNGVLFIDEAYQLMTNRDDSGDNFGSECLTTINEFMSEHPEDLILIFAGYEDTMEETIFRVQPGLRRRFMWHFNIEPYTAKELSDIIIKQAGDNNWKLSDDVNSEWLTNLVGNNKEYFKNYGGDTERLIFYTSIEHACSRIINPNIEIGILNQDMINGGLNRLMKNYKVKEKVSEFIYM